MVNLSSHDASLLSKQINSLLESTSAEGYIFAGCINNQINPIKIYFMFIHTNSEAPMYTCNELLSPNIYSELSNNLIKGKEFRGSITICQKSFIYKFIIYEEAKLTSKNSKYKLLEFNDFDCLNFDISKRETYGEKFRGVILGRSLADSYIVFLSDNSVNC